MKPELQVIFDSTPEDEPRSKLDPYRELILRWRRQGKTYRKICGLLAERCDIKMNSGSLFRYIKRRSRPRKALPEIEIETSQKAEAACTTPAARSQIITAAQNRPSLQSFRNKPARPPKPAVLQEFRYDEDKPLTIDRSIKD
jgi:hypothetical protein